MIVSISTRRLRGDFSHVLKQLSCMKCMAVGRRAGVNVTVVGGILITEVFYPLVPQKISLFKHRSIGQDFGFKGWIIFIKFAHSTLFLL